MKTIISIAVITLILFTACQKVVDANDLLETEEKIFITSYIAPQDTLLRVNVTRALPTFGTSLSVQNQEANEAKFLVQDAQVSISDETGNTTDLFYSEENKTYLVEASSLAILGGQTYILKVVVDGKEYSASCKIPKKVTEINEQINYRESQFGGREADINLSFQDLIGQRNFYVVGGQGTSTFQFEGEEPQTSNFDLFFGSDEFLSDNLEDGGVLNGNSIITIGNEVQVLESAITLQVANVEEALFQNLRTASTNVDTEGNPFVEYAIAPNSFSGEGVVGVFAGYQLTKKVIEIE